MFKSTGYWEQEWNTIFGSIKPRDVALGETSTIQNKQQNIPLEILF